MIALTGVEKQFGPTRALWPTDLTLETGRTTVLIGPSGCGKSTLLRLMVGLITPDAGEIRFDGSLADAWPLTRRRIGYVIQEGGLFPHLTARVNVALMARYVGWSSDHIASRLDELRLLVKLPEAAIDRFPVQLSGGQRQRVSLMRALMLEPDVLLLDEPLGALDPMIRAELQIDLRAIVRELRQTVALVTHDLAEAAFFADEIVLMKDGRIVQRGAMADLKDNPVNPFVTQFIEAQRQLGEIGL